MATASSSNSLSKKIQRSKIIRKDNNKKKQQVHYVYSCESQPLKTYSSTPDDNAENNDDENVENISGNTNEKGVIGASWLRSRLVTGSSRTSILFLEFNEHDYCTTDKNENVEDNNGKSGIVRVNFDAYLSPPSSVNSLQTQSHDFRLGSVVCEIDLVHDDAVRNEGARVSDLEFVDCKSDDRPKKSVLYSPSKLKRVFTRKETNVLDKSAVVSSSPSLINPESSFLRILVEVYTNGSPVEKLWFDRIGIVNQLSKNEEGEIDVSVASNASNSIHFDDAQDRRDADDSTRYNTLFDDCTTVDGGDNSTFRSIDTLADTLASNKLDYNSVGNVSRNEITLDTILSCNVKEFINDCDNYSAYEAPAYGSPQIKSVVYLDDEDENDEQFDENLRDENLNDSLKMESLEPKNSIPELPADEAIVVNKDQIQGIDFDSPTKSDKASVPHEKAKIKFTPKVERYPPLRDKRKPIELSDDRKLSIGSCNSERRESIKDDIDNESRSTYTFNSTLSVERKAEIDYKSSLFDDDTTASDQKLNSSQDLSFFSIFYRCLGQEGDVSDVSVEACSGPSKVVEHAARSKRSEALNIDIPDEN